MALTDVRHMVHKGNGVINYSILFNIIRDQDRIISLEWFFSNIGIQEKISLER